MFRRAMCLLKHIRHEAEGAVLTEALIVIPFLTFFAAGILEFGSLFWEKQIIETGLRDAARFIARCQSSSSFSAKCRDEDNDGTVAGKTLATQIAFYGTADKAATALRWCRWRPASAASSECGTGKTLDPTEITFELVDRSMVVSGKTVTQKVVVAGTEYKHQVMSFLAPAWPIFGWNGLSTITVQAFHEERYLGW